LKESTVEDFIRTIKEDKQLRRYRETDGYKNLDEEGKYEKLKNYIFNTPDLRVKFSNTKEVDEVCRQIAAEDDDIF
jgi:hypothetical protein